MPPSNEIHAAIDIGTNSMHLVIAKINESGGLDILTTERETTRLGEGMGPQRVMTESAIQRGIATLQRFKQIADGYDASISAIATSAVREAKNRQVFLSLARSEVGIQIQVISGVEEARLIHSGVTQALDVYQKRILAFDIGGGSTELVVGENYKVLASRSTKLGCIRLTDEFFPEGKVSVGSEMACRNHIRSYLAGVKTDFNKHDFEMAIGSSGTVNAVAIMAAMERGQNINQVNGAVFAAEEVHHLAEKIFASDPKSRREIPGLEDKRVDIITGGIALLSELLYAFDIAEVNVSGYALREGILFDQLVPGDSQYPVDLRQSNVEWLAQQLDPDPEHAKKAADLALQIFDLTAELHGLDSQSRDLLNMSAQLQNIGLSISHTSHHKHSGYMIRHSDTLTGFNEAEIEIMSLVARYHRRAKPSKAHPEFAILDKEDKYIVRCLAGMLRIAIGLDRRHLRVVDKLSAHHDLNSKKLTITATSETSGVDLGLELWSANDRKSLLEQVLDLTIDVV